MTNKNEEQDEGIGVYNKWLIAIAIVAAAMFIYNKAMARGVELLAPHLPKPGYTKVCVGKFDKYGELVDMECKLTPKPAPIKRDTIIRGH